MNKFKITLGILIILLFVGGCDSADNQRDISTEELNSSQDEASKAEGKVIWGNSIKEEKEKLENLAKEIDEQIRKKQEHRNEILTEIEKIEGKIKWESLSKEEKERIEKLIKEIGEEVRELEERGNEMQSITEKTEEKIN